MIKNVTFVHQLKHKKVNNALFFQQQKTSSYERSKTNNDNYNEEINK